MFRELEDGEDVIPLLTDTTTSGEGAGDTLGHWVTLGSRENEQVSEDSTVQRIDFMDPWGGGSTADNKYDVGTNANGEPTTEGYDLDGGGASATIVGYIKVSPPEGGGEELRSGRSIDKMPAEPPWIPVDAGLCRGNGLVDTLYWDTTGFLPGLYLIEVVTVDDQAFVCRDIILGWIPDTSTDDDPETPKLKTGLHGTYPNPFNPTTHIVFSLERDGPVTIAIYDIAGRRVRSLMDGKMTSAGRYTITWDGLDDQGRNVSSGVYFCRFQAEDEAASTKMILLR
jgi:hypothetical protein